MIKNRLLNAVRIFSLAVALLSFPFSSAFADTMDDILKSGKVKIGVSLFTPWTLKNDAGILSGFEVDVANKLAQDMGVDSEFHIYEWDKIIDALMSGEIDVIAGGMAITPARALKINFSQPYAESGLQLIANTAKTKHIDSLKKANHPDVKFAVVAGSAAQELVENLFDNASIQAYETVDEASQAVIEGTVHALVASSPQPELLVLKHADTLDLPLDAPLVTYKAGLATQKGQQEWLNFLNAWITARSADKWLSATHKYWFESLKWHEASN
jgi:polar amino acid transport system substrate-binding protein